MWRKELGLMASFSKLTHFRFFSTLNGVRDLLGEWLHGCQRLLQYICSVYYKKKKKKKEKE